MSGSIHEDGIQHLYVHVPFCPVKCEYCAFVTHIGSLKLAGPYVDALRTELRLRAGARPSGPLKTLYFGGGTPSLLEPGQIGAVIERVVELFGLKGDAEVTLECHPSTVSLERLTAYRAAGVTRVSFGAESMQPDELRALGRSHRPDEVADAVVFARAAGMRSVALDLMYGIPGQTLESWEASLRDVLALDVDHLSLYPLQLEPKTVFHRRHRRGELLLPEDETVVAMYGVACRLLRERGFEHYEVSNWCRTGHACRHSLAYWRNEEFIAVGAGAHGYLRPERTENMRHTSRYIERVRDGGDPVEHREPVDRRTHASETMMLGLRLLEEGPALHRVAEELEADPLAVFAGDINRLLSAGLVEVVENRVLLCEDAVPLANEVWESFLLD
jgi:oxygen-independent coproporphyrinogen-3 oxidase